MHSERIFFVSAAVAIVATGCVSQVVSNNSLNDNVRSHVQKCHGAGRDHRTCMEVASTLCRTGFDIFEQSIAEEDGVVRRGYYFRCKA